MYVKEFQNEMKETTKLVLAIEDLKIVQQHFYKYKLLEQKKAELGDKFTEDEFSISDRKYLSIALQQGGRLVEKKQKKISKFDPLKIAVLGGWRCLLKKFKGILILF